MRNIIVILTALLLSSCGIYGKYERPEVKTDGIYGDLVADDTTNMGNLSWREVFTDPCLQDLIESALEYNVDLQLANLRVNQAEQTLKVARLAFLPTFAVAPQGTVTQFRTDKVPGVSRVSQTYQLPLTASWEIDVFGRIRNAKQKAKALYYYSIEYQQAVQTQLISGMANMYYTLLMLDSQLEISKKTADIWAENVRTMQALKDAGYTNEAAVSQARANYFAVESGVKGLEENINIVENSISLLLADVPGEIKRGKLEGQQFPEDLAIGVPIQMLANRPDVKMAEHNLAQAFYATAEARSAFYPSINLSGLAGWTNSAGIITNPGKVILSAVGSILQPIFNGGAIRGRVRIAEADQEAAKLNFQQSILSAGSEVNDAMAKYQTAKSKAELNVEQIKSLEKAVESTKLLMKHGPTNYLEVLTAEQMLLSAYLNQTAIKFDEIQSVITLYRALGGGRDLDDKVQEEKGNKRVTMAKIRE